MLNLNPEPLSSSLAQIPDSLYKGTIQGQQMASNQQGMQNAAETQAQNTQTFQQNQQISATKALMDQKNQQNTEQQTTFTNAKSALDILQPYLDSAAKDGQTSLDDAKNRLSENPLITKSLSGIGMNISDMIVKAKNGKIGEVKLPITLTPDLKAKLEKENGITLAPNAKLFFTKDKDGNTGYQTNTGLDFNQQMQLKRAGAANTYVNNVTSHEKNKLTDAEISIADTFEKDPQIKKGKEKTTIYDEIIGNLHQGTNMGDSAAVDSYLKLKTGRISNIVYKDFAGKTDPLSRAKRWVYANSPGGEGTKRDPADRAAFVRLVHQDIDSNDKAMQRAEDSFVNSRSVTYKMSKDDVRKAVSPITEQIKSKKNIPQNDNDTKAVQWAKANSNDPRAKRILKLHGL